ncbi:NAD(P)H-dependent flavin oxidoreductase YrpB (nitropropane dioxygenase family) [Halanaerobium saccharolyticum]|uniref:Probable nitronate monooxygenase n=1 Tax=Halanaerobium saccharolyticum TaxID=43595 RepID=A0A4V3G437_9FIRM|nr:nitronate monooxygenase [Halanaerobium saccharolyticum]RAK05110.1 NAD(P)H-dependent flavin oxidoreductase YrpB (nitropropane dioxygenase family) [Halanaerobium saccharolyticum]TDV98877.1 NAD(P)H-dependent flavin oxidoreductase YrpB (nitropropane dioxygenase family) [Halanaerobium saccharolyticum]TDX51579.1 NAD(P)H-dependent flavin oxidoreductase YrpB (nitropropane dioxygenase family) [Halanaerobium saccharolyticum]
MKLPKLKIGDLKAKFPIIQGGMAIRVSMAELAAAVANEGGIGVIGASVMTPQELKSEIKKARKLSDGIIGVNIMFAATGFSELLKASVEAGIDCIISGAGFSRDMFGVGKESNTPVIPIVSSLKLARISQKLGAAAVVVEGGNAGGHLGSDEYSFDLVKKITGKVDIPVIGAGEVVTPADIESMFELGVDGVQMGTRFLASKEASIAEEFKELCVEATSDDVIKIMSSAGYYANAIKTRFSELIEAGEAPPPANCTDCLKTCSREFCIKDALINARAGDLENGVFFTGASIGKINEILSTKEIFQQIKEYFSD